MNGTRSIFTEKGIRNAAEGWVKNVVETHQAALELLPEAYVHLRYEDLLKEPKTQMGRVWSLLGASLEISRIMGSPGPGAPAKPGRGMAAPESGRHRRFRAKGQVRFLAEFIHG